MREIRAKKRNAVTLIELLVIIAIIGVLAGLLVAGVQRAREAAARADSVNNLRQIGMAMQLYQNRTGAYPTEAGPAGQSPSFYKAILSDLEQPNAINVTSANAPSVRSFLCSARRGTEVGPKRDFGYASSLALDSLGPSILDSGPVRPIDITRGAANVYLLTSLWMAPSNYSGGDPTDLGWLTKNNSRIHGSAIVQDSDPDGSDAYLGGPFANSLPHLYADGHVAELSYAGYSNQWSYLLNGECVVAAGAAVTSSGGGAESGSSAGTTPSNPLMPSSGSALDGYTFTSTSNAAADAAAINEAINQYFEGGPDMTDHAASSQFQSLLSNPTPDNITAALNMLKGGLCSLDTSNQTIMGALNTALNNYRTNPSAQNTQSLVKQLQQFTPFDADGTTVWIDPEIATGYDYTVSGNSFKSVILPKPLPRGQKMFELVVNGQTYPLEAGKRFDFTKVSPDGVAFFTIRGIDVAEKLDPTNFNAFVTGLTFVNGDPWDVKMTPRTIRTGMPRWSWLLIGVVALSLIAGFIVWGRHRQENSLA